MNRRFFTNAFSFVAAIVISFSSFSVTANAASNSTTASVNRESILTATAENYSNVTTVKWDGYWKQSQDVHDGKIPVSLLNDPVYCSMNLPSESMSDYTKQTNRDNAHMIGTTSSPDAAKCVSIGAIYKTSGAKLPSNFNIYIGKIDLFAYSKSQESWIVLDSQPYPADAMIYSVPWVGASAYRCTNVTKYSNYMKINLNAEELEMEMTVDPNTNKKKAVGKTLHFWGVKQPIDKEDYLYYACAYDFWADSSVAGKLTAVNAIDVKKATGTTTVVQLYSSRGYSSTTTKKTTWGQTVPNSEYLNCSAYVLNQLHQNGKTGDTICVRKEAPVVEEAAIDPIVENPTTEPSSNPENASTEEPAESKTNSVTEPEITPAVEPTVQHEEDPVITEPVSEANQGEPTLVDPEIVEPVVTEPEVTEPEVVEPEIIEPVVSEPEVVEPEIIEPVVSEPEVVEPEVTEPVVIEPEIIEPEVVEPVVTEPEIVEPVVTEPEVTQPVVVEPVVTEPEIVEPVAAQPAVTQPAASEPAVSEPAVVAPAASEPEISEPVVADTEADDTMPLVKDSSLPVQDQSDNTGNNSGSVPEENSSIPTSNNAESNEDSGKNTVPEITNPTNSENKKEIVDTSIKKTNIKSFKSYDNKLMINWKKGTSKISGYQIQYSTDKNFNKNVSTIKVSKASATSKTIKNLKKNKTYYVRIRTYTKSTKKLVYSSWGKKSSVKIK